MPTLYRLLQDEYDPAWGIRKSGSRDGLEELSRLSVLWRPNSIYKLKRWKLDSAHADESIYIGSPKRLKYAKQRLAWEKKLLALGKAESSGETVLAIKHLKARKHLHATVKSRGLKRSVKYRQALESSFDNTVFIEAEFEDESKLDVAVWFTQTQEGWRVGLESHVSNITNPENHPALLPFMAVNKDRSLDAGLRSLCLEGTARMITTTESALATESASPILVGEHHYLGFSFGPNLQKAVKSEMPLTLICEKADSGRWRSTPFNLQFAEFSLSSCVLLVNTQIIEEVSHSTCYLFGLGADNRPYYSQLGDDECTLRWHLYLDNSLRFEPPSGYGAESASGGLPALENDFYLSSEQAFPDLEDLASFDQLMGGNEWRCKGVTAEIYQSLNQPQLLHLQFGISLTTGGMTDVALAFRGTPTIGTSTNFAYERSFFRIGIGQPHDSGLRNIYHESQLRMRVYDCPCEGYFEPDSSLVINLRPINVFDIPAFAKHFNVTLPFRLFQPLDQFALRVHASSGAWQMFASDDSGFELNPPVESTP